MLKQKRITPLPAILVSICASSIILPRSAQAQSVQRIQIVDNFFSSDRDTRRAAQKAFHNSWEHDQGAISALIQETTDEARKPNHNVEGVYDALSELNRLPPESTQDPDIQKRIVALANVASGNSSDSADLAASLRQKFPDAMATASPNTQAPASPHYVLTVGNMTPFDGISSGPNAADTDYLSLSVKSSAGDHYENTIGPNNLRKSANPTNWDLSTPPIAVPANSGATTTISVTVTNKGHFGSNPTMTKAEIEGAIRAAITSAVAKGITAAGAAFGIPIPDQIAQALANAGVKKVDPDCDSTLFSPILTYDGATLDRGPPPGWSVEGPNKYQIVLDYGGPGVNNGRGGLNGKITDIPPNCDAGVHYNIQLHLTKIP